MTQYQDAHYNTCSRRMVVDCSNTSIAAILLHSILRMLIGSSVGLHICEKKGWHNLKTSDTSACFSLMLMHLRHTVPPLVKDGKWMGFKNWPTVHCLMLMNEHVLLSLF